MEAERGWREPTIVFGGMVILLGLIDIMIGGGGIKRCREGEEGDEQKAGYDSPNVEAKPHCDNVAGLTSDLNVIWGKSCLARVHNVVPMIMIPNTRFSCNITLVPT